MYTIINFLSYYIVIYYKEAEMQYVKKYEQKTH